MGVCRRTWWSGRGLDVHHGLPGPCIVALGLCVLVGGTPLGAQTRWMDVARSRVTVRIPAPGVRAAPGLVLEAPLAEGSVDDPDTAAPHLALVIDVDRLRVVGPGRSADDRRRVLARLVGPDRLDGRRFPRITYHSLTIDVLAGGVWRVHGELELHGRFLPLDLQAERRGDRFTGTVTVSPPDFGITPAPVGDDVQVEFDVALEAP